MSENFIDGPMLEMYLFEMDQGIEQLEAAVLSSEKSSNFSPDSINEIFRIMHTIKGASAMMCFTSIATFAHHIEDLFYFIREQNSLQLECSVLSDLVFEGVDFIKVELQKVKNGDEAEGDTSMLIRKIQEYLTRLKQQNQTTDDSEHCIMPQQQDAAEVHQDLISSTYKNAYKATVYFQEGCEMENVRAYSIIHKLNDIADEISFQPEDIIDDDDTVMIIREQGFQIYFKTKMNYEEMHIFFHQTVFLNDLELEQLEKDQPIELSAPVLTSAKESPVTTTGEKGETNSAINQSIISVSVTKLDQLMDLMGEMVISEAMVTQNPDLVGLQLDSFQKAAQQLNKITKELQDIVISMRMVPLTTTFHKMHRIVRDMGKKLSKEICLQLSGEDTEVDKKIIEHLADPLMHLIRNSIDHGIEPTEQRIAAGKSKAGNISLLARNNGSDVLVIIQDDGKGLNKEKIVKQARLHGLLTKPENELTDKDIYALIFLPGFSTNESVTEFSGRGVGMDVVVKNIEAVDGTIFVDSVEGQGTIFTMKIPLTLAIIDGLNINVGLSRYTIPINAIKETFWPKVNDLICDPEGNELIMVRGQCYPVLRLHNYFKVTTNVTELTDGIMIMVEQDEKSSCLFVDKLLGQQEVVVKALPLYLKNTSKVKGISGCTLLGDGSISLIIDVNDLMSRTI